MGPLVLQAETLIEENPAPTHAGCGHALEVLGLAHALVALRLIVEMLAAANEKFQGLVGQPCHVPGQFALLPRADLPAGLDRGVVSRLARRIVLGRAGICRPWLGCRRLGLARPLSGRRIAVKITAYTAAEIMPKADAGLRVSFIIAATPVPSAGVNRFALAGL